MYSSSHSATGSASLYTSSIAQIPAIPLIQSNGDFAAASNYDLGSNSGGDIAASRVLGPMERFINEQDFESPCVFYARISAKDKSHTLIWYVSLVKHML